MIQRKSHILAIDDEPSNLRALAGILHGEHELILARGGAEGLERLRVGPLPDLVLLDIAMPGLDGYQVLRRVQADPRTRSIPVIFITGHGSIEDEVRGLAAGAVDYLTKPVQPATVRARVALHLRLRRQQQELDRYRITLISAGEGVIATDAAGCVTMINPEAAKLTGWDAEDAVGKPLPLVFHLIDEGSRVAFPNLAHQVMSGSIALARLDRGLLLSRTGAAFPLDLSGAPILDEEGQPVGAALVFRDQTHERELQRRLEESERNFRSYFELGCVGMAVTAADTTWVHVNQRLCAILGATADELKCRTWTELTHPDDLASDQACFHRVLAGEIEGYDLEKRFIRLDGRVIHTDLSVRCVRRADGSVDHFLAAIQDITERKQAAEKLRLAASVFASSDEGIMITDADSVIVDVNPAFTRITGYDREEVLLRRPSMLSSGRHGPDFYRALWTSLTEQGRWRGEIWNRSKFGREFPELLTISAVRGGDDRISHYVGLFSDISQIKEQEQKLERIAHHDALTGLPNRWLLRDRLEQAIGLSRRMQQYLAVCYLDLDGFKPVNDSFGHEAGDALLIEVAQRLQAAVRVGDTVARLGGDEFVVLLAGMQKRDEIEPALLRVLNEIIRPVSITGRLVRVTASIGVALCPRDGVEGDTLMRRADQAMYLAKQSGKNQFRLVGDGL